MIISQQYFDAFALVLNTGRYTYPQWLIDGEAIEDADGHFFDADCVSQLSRIIQATKAQIVISSAWRSRGLKRMRAYGKIANYKAILWMLPPQYID